MSYEVRTAVFEGPLDLLLQLITRHQVDITAVSLADLVTEYLAFVDEMRSLDLEVTSEFVLIAATLVQLKARHLLPDDRPIDLDEELALMEERDRLLARLLACVTFKDVATVLHHRLSEAVRLHPRTHGFDVQLELGPPDVIIPVDAEGLAALAAKAFVDVPEEPNLDHLELDLPSVQEAIVDLRARVERDATSTFSDLVDGCSRKVEVVAYFLALLELARWGVVKVSQADWTAQIDVHAAESAVEFTSEWG